MANKIEAQHCRLLLPGKSNGIKEKATKRRSIRELNAQTHEIANQLSVINLCCVKLRGSLAQESHRDRLKELDVIEMAVMEAADLLDKFNESLTAVSHFARDERKDPPLPRPSNTSTRNIYDISPRLGRGR